MHLLRFEPGTRNKLLAYYGITLENYLTYKAEMFNPLRPGVGTGSKELYQHLLNHYILGRLKTQDKRRDFQKWRKICWNFEAGRRGEGSYFFVLAGVQACEESLSLFWLISVVLQFVFLNSYFVIRYSQFALCINSVRKSLLRLKAFIPIASEY